MFTWESFATVHAYAAVISHSQCIRIVLFLLYRKHFDCYKTLIIMLVIKCSKLTTFSGRLRVFLYLYRHYYTILVGINNNSFRFECFFRVVIFFMSLVFDLRTSNIFCSDNVKIWYPWAFATGESSSVTIRRKQISHEAKQVMDYMYQSLLRWDLNTTDALTETSALSSTFLFSVKDIILKPITPR